MSTSEPSSKETESGNSTDGLMDDRVFPKATRQMRTNGRLHAPLASTVIFSSQAHRAGHPKFRAAMQGFNCDTVTRLESRYPSPV
jgi:hypothetical protein